ncbi:translation initiation factor 2 [Viridibacillus sp. NPDC096237]|uniref:translation initiation factor 2 n=1 Tax=Viridibacillus sp. NPDC096237 TaxID=3390721 RepID=UPI003D058D8C
MNEINKNLGKDRNQLALQAAELAVIADVITTLGYTISTISAILTLEAEQQNQNHQENDKKNNKNMQKQIDYLTIELEKLKNQVNKKSHHRK